MDELINKFKKIKISNDHKKNILAIIYSLKLLNKNNKLIFKNYKDNIYLFFFNNITCLSNVNHQNIIMKFKISEKDFENNFIIEWFCPICKKLVPYAKIDQFSHKINIIDQINDDNILCAWKLLNLI